MESEFWTSLPERASAAVRRNGDDGSDCRAAQARVSALEVEVAELRSALTRDGARRALCARERSARGSVRRALVLWRVNAVSAGASRQRGRRRPPRPARRTANASDAQLCMLRVLRLDAVRCVDRASETALAFGRWMRFAIAAAERERVRDEGGVQQQAQRTLVLSVLSRKQREAALQQRRRAEDALASEERAQILSALAEQQQQQQQQRREREAQRAADATSAAALRVVADAHAESLLSLDRLASEPGVTLSAEAYARVVRTHDALAALAASGDVHRPEWAQAVCDSLKVLAAVLTEAEHMEPSLLERRGASPPAVAPRAPPRPVAWHELLAALF